MPRRTLIGSILWFPWSVVVWIATLVWLGTMGILALAVSPFIPFHKFQIRWINQQASWPIWFALSPPKVTYDPGYDPSRVSIFTQNHVSMLDGPIGCAAIRVRFCGMENAAHLKVPGYGWLMTAGNAVPVHPGKPGKYGELADAVRERASRGISVLTFPEGHRTLDGKMRKFRAGVFRIARDAGLPIVPIAVRGASRMLPKGAFTIRPTPIEIYMGPQFETEGLSNEELGELMDRVREVMIAWIDRGEMVGSADRETDQPAAPAKTAASG